MNLTPADDDEWEAAGLNLDSLKLNEPVIVKNNQPAFIMPARQLNRPNVEESSFLQDLPTVKQSSQQSQGGGGSPFAPALVIESNELIDSALLNAIENPRERMQVLNLENVLLIFVKSSERCMELPPVHNSFRRLLAYRIAQRFGLTHAVSDTLNENGERGILIYRTTDTHIPRPLLIDMPPPVGDYPSDSSPFGSSQNLEAASGNETAVPKKMIMMKRSPNRELDNKKEASKKEKLTAEEREKAYAEARARIFGAEAEAAAALSALAAGAVASGTLSKSNSENRIDKTVSVPRTLSASPSFVSQPITHTSPVNGAANLAAAKKKAQVNLGKKAAVPLKEVPVLTTTSRSLNDLKPPSPPLDKMYKKKAIDVNAWKEKRSTERDQETERSDPDFSRRNSNSNSSNTRNNQYAPEGYRNQGQQEIPYQHQGQNPNQGVGGVPGGNGGGMMNPASVSQGYQQNYQLPPDYSQPPYPNPQMMPYGAPQNPFQPPYNMQMQPGSPTHLQQQQQWQNMSQQPMLMNPNQGNNYYTHPLGLGPLPPGANMNGINPLGPGPLPNMNMYQQPMQQPGLGLPQQGLVQGSLGYPPQYNPYPPLPGNIPNYDYNKLSVEQNQNPPSV